MKNYVIAERLCMLVLVIGARLLLSVLDPRSSRLLSFCSILEARACCLFARSSESAGGPVSRLLDKLRELLSHPAACAQSSKLEAAVIDI